ncbi:MipA/OmpV family protein [Desulfovibrio cuneatus]|uniref:MipA/OmpV family protein n=1 Tax=Desulfovibrio cuneatus TaxID=159728 RepID=UPI000551962F|nr:MipA/OmpV family protein [Desulfovibrio cuneatus]
MSTGNIPAKEAIVKCFTLFRPFFSSFLLFLLFTAPVHAQENTSSSDGLDHHISIGAAGIVMPEFEGADSYKVMPFPLIEYSNKYFFISTLKGAGVNIISTPTITAGPVLTYRFGRKENASDLLKGLGDVDGGVEAGAFFNWQFHQRLGAEVTALHDLGDAKGFTADVSLTYNQPLITNLSFALQASAQFADSEYNKQFFGITGKQSQRSGYDRYSPDGGIKHVSIKPALNYTFFEYYNLGVFYEYKRLTGPAADSPLVKKGSADQSTTGISLSWSY